MNEDRTRWSVVLLAVTAGVVIAFQIGKVPASIPALQRELGLTLVDAGWVVSLLYGFAALTGLATGAAADRLGARRVAVFGLLCASAGSLTGALAGGLWPLLASRLVEGLGAVAVLVTAPGLILRAVHPRDMRLAMGIWGAFMPTGMAVMLTLTPLLLAALGWRGLWYVNAAILLGFAGWLWAGTAATPDPDRQARRAETFWADAGEVLRRQGPLLLALLFGLYAFSYLCMTAFLPKYLVETRAWTEAAAALVTALVIAANAAGNVLGGGLAHHGAPRWSLMAGGIGGMACLAWFIYQPWMPALAAVAVAFAFSLVAGLVPASIFASVPLHAPRAGRVAGVNGLILQVTNLGQLTGPPLFAAVVAASSWSQGPWLIAGMSAAGVAVALLLRRGERPRERQNEHPGERREPPRQAT